MEMRRSMMVSSSSISHLKKLPFRAFAAYEENCPVDADVEHRQRLLLDEYRSKFEVLSLPDPLTIKLGWCGEETGMSFWPKLYFMDISRYFSSTLSRESLWQRLECEYKEGKAYRYYSNGFVGEVHINNITELSKYCYLKAKCVPSQRVSSKQYDVWVVVEKDGPNMPGGKILAGYCTCTAGLLGKILIKCTLGMI